MKPQKPLTIVIKLGTSSILDEKSNDPLLPIIALIVSTAVNLRRQGHRVIIVSSGAIGVGLRRMHQEKRPKHLAKLQALAAIGQCGLMSQWDHLFTQYRQDIAQILLTRNDIADRTRYLNAQSTFNELLDMGVIPIVNENDTLAVAEIKFGDNDTLSAITAAMVHADFLFLMTDVDCLYDKNPRIHADAQPIEVVEDIGALQADVSTTGSALGTGGMSTKIVAARLATSAGVTTIITRASSPGNIARILEHVQGLRSPSQTPAAAPAAGPATATTASTASQAVGSQSSTAIGTPQTEVSVDSLASSTSTLAVSSSSGPDSRGSGSSPPSGKGPVPLHTRFVASRHPIRDRYFWILHGLAPRGTLYIDQGAHRALVGKAGLLPVGVVHVEGEFAANEAVRLVVVDRATWRPPPSSSSTGTSDSGGAAASTGVEVGRALVNYSNGEIMRIKGHKTTDIKALLGYADSEHVAQREYISFFQRNSRPATPTLSQ